MLHQTNQGEQRRAVRTAVPAMYTVVRVRPAGEQRYRWTGFIYDVSETGIRFELDDPLANGQSLDVRMTLPGSRPVTINATGTVVRTHDDEPGPVRMGLQFDQFRTHTDRDRLNDYLSQRTASSSAA